MNITFGKYNGKSIERLILTEPDYILWILEQTTTMGPVAKIQPEVKRLMTIFDKKRLQNKCLGCGKIATYCSAYMVNLRSLYWWCDECDPYQNQNGAISGKLHILRTYQDVIKNVRPLPGGEKSDLKLLIKAISESKGLARPINDNNVKSFFCVS